MPEPSGGGGLSSFHVILLVMVVVGGSLFALMILPRIMYQSSYQASMSFDKEHMNPFPTKVCRVTLSPSTKQTILTGREGRVICNLPLPYLVRVGEPVDTGGFLPIAGRLVVNKTYSGSEGIPFTVNPCTGAQVLVTSGKNYFFEEVPSTIVCG
jgi:hypothetical protein